MKFNIEIHAQFPSRYSRQLVISEDNLELKSSVVDSRSDEAKELALELIRCGYEILSHHELYKEK